MTQINGPAVAFFALAAGFPPTIVPTMVAIAIAESGKDPEVVNSIGCVGLWQINQPVWVKQYPKWTVDYLKNPLNNARAAKVVYDQQGLSAWETYTTSDPNKTYKRFLVGGQNALKTANVPGYKPNLPSGTVQDIISGASDAASSGVTSTVSGALDAAGQVGRLADLVAAAGQWITNPHNLIRVAWVVVGGVVLVVTVGSLAKPVTQPIVNTAKKAGKLAAVA
ncbi:MAG TPA: transglycosylase SLT domain-containing protein [Ktedonobacteraceae bacterium]|nr:transglycosylase SLT domain-containing protein [Ktedonobacteraceae bacterium]